MAPIHLAGFLEDVDAAGAFNELSPLTDSRLLVSGNAYRVPTGLNQIILMAGGADGVVAPRIRLDSPTLGQLTRPEITPLNSQNAAAVEPDSPAKVDDRRFNPLRLGNDELITASLFNNSAAVQDQWALLWFSDGAPSPIEGQDIFTVRGSATTTLVVNTWTQHEVTLDENLPPGRYGIVGMRAESLGMVASRLIPRIGDFWRPGVIGTDTILDIIPDYFRNGGLGVWAEFPFTQFPAVEDLSVIADTVETYYFDLVKLG